MAESAQKLWSAKNYPQLVGEDLRFSAQEKIQGIYSKIEGFSEGLQDSHRNIKKTTQHIRSLFGYTEVLEKMSGANDNLKSAKVVLQSKDRSVLEEGESIKTALQSFEKLQSDLRSITDYIQTLDASSYDEGTIEELEARLVDLSSLEQLFEELKNTVSLEDESDTALFDVETFVKAQGEIFAFESENPLDALAQIRVGLVERKVDELENRLMRLEGSAITSDDLEKRLRVFRSEIFQDLDGELMKQREFSGFEGTQEIRECQSAIQASANILKEGLLNGEKGFALLGTLFPRQSPDSFLKNVSFSVDLHPFVRDYQKNLERDGSIGMDRQAFENFQRLSVLQDKNQELFGDFLFENFPTETEKGLYNTIAIPLRLGELIVGMIQVKVAEDIAIPEPHSTGLSEVVGMIQRSFEAEFPNKREVVAALLKYKEKIETAHDLEDQKEQHAQFVHAENPLITLIANTPQNLKGRQAEIVGEDPEHFKKGSKSFTSGTGKFHARVRAKLAEDSETKKNYEDMEALIQLYEDFLLDNEYHTKSKMFEFLLENTQKSEGGFYSADVIDEVVDQLNDIVSSAQGEDVPESIKALQQIDIQNSFDGVRIELKNKLIYQRQREIFKGYVLVLSREVVSSAKTTEEFMNDCKNQDLSGAKKDAYDFGKQVLPVFPLLQNKLNEYISDDFSGLLSDSIEPTNVVLERIQERVEEFLEKHGVKPDVLRVFQSMQEQAQNSLHSSFDIDTKIITEVWYKLIKKSARNYSITPTENYVFSNICSLEDADLCIHGHGPDDGDDVFGELADDFALLASDPQSKEEEDLQIKAFMRVQKYLQETFDESDSLNKIAMETQVMLLYFFMDPNVPHFISKVTAAFEKLSSKTLLIQNKASHEVFRANTREDLLDIECIDKAKEPILFFDSIEQYYQFVQDKEALEILESSFDVSRLPNKYAVENYKVFIRNHGALADCLSRNTGKFPMIIDLSGRNYFGDIRSRADRHVRGELDVREEAACIQDPKRLYYLWRIHRAIGENDTIAYGEWSMLTGRHEHEKRIRKATS